MSNFLDPAAVIKQYESGGNYTIGVGGADLSSAPLGPDGFPQWAGSGKSHAAGAYQFEPETWALYALRLGITDFSPKSQDAVFVACFDVRGFDDWLPFDAQLAAAVAAAGGTGNYSLGATWLGIGPPAPIPPPAPPPAPPPPPPTPASGTYVGTLYGLGGTPLKLSVTIGSMMLAAALGGAVVMAPKSPQVAQAPIPQAQASADEPKMCAFDFNNGSIPTTFTLDRNLRAVPITSGMGR